MEVEVGWKLEGRDRGGRRVGGEMKLNGEG